MLITTQIEVFAVLCSHVFHTYKKQILVIHSFYWSLELHINRNLIYYAKIDRVNLLDRKQFDVFFHLFLQFARISRLLM